MRAFVPAVALLMLVCGAVSATEIVDKKENHAFVVPDDWEDDHGQFGLWIRAESGGSLGESKLTFKAQSVEEASQRLDRIFANANTTFHPIGKSQLVEGKTWTGRITAFEGTVNTILQMVAKDSRKYRVFHLTVPNEKYRKDKETYWTILRTWRSPAK